MDTIDTIFALATQHAKSGIAIIRISGENAKDVLPVFSVTQPVSPRKAVLSKLFSTDAGLIDQAILVLFESPHSFTGEDVLEIHCHGSIAVIETILDVLSGIPNLRHAEAGEFSKRAFYNHKMDLTQAEGLEDLINAETLLQRKQALRSFSGELRDLYDKWRQDIIKLLSLIEAQIDFPDEDLPQGISKDFSDRRSTLIKEISEHLQNNSGHKIRNGIDIAIIGAPNVGKSSFANKLSATNSAIVTDIAGTTRDLIKIDIEIAGYPVRLIDTAGIRDANNIIEQEGIRRSIKCAEQADIVILLLSPSELDLYTKYVNHKAEYIIFVSKADQIYDKLKLPPGIALLSIYEQELFDNAVLCIENKLKQLFKTSNSPVITRARYKDALNNCLHHLSKIDFNNEVVLLSEELRLASDSIARITGRIGTEDVLNNLFASFCIGK